MRALLPLANGDLIAGGDFTRIDALGVGHVSRWNGTAWVALGPAVPAGDSPAGQGGAGGISNSVGGSFNPSLAADTTDTDGRLALAWEDESATGDIYVWVRVWNGVDAWNELAGSASQLRLIL